MSRQDIVNKSDPSKSPWFNGKYRVTPETSRLLQEAVFKDGGGWGYGCKGQIAHTDQPFLVVRGKEITFSNDEHYFETCVFLPEKQPPQVKSPQPKKDFVVGKWYKCVEPSKDNGLERNKYYELLNASAVSEGLRFAGKADGCYWSKSRFDINSESDYDPSTAQPDGCTAYVVFKHESKWGTEYGTKEYAYKCSREDYTQYRESRAFDEDVFALVDVSGTEKTVKVVRIEAIADPKATKSIVRILPNSVDTDVKDVVKSPSYTVNAVVTGFTKKHVVFLDNPKFNQQEEVNMSIQRKSVKVELFDNDQGLPVEHSLVGAWDNYVTEDSDYITVQEIISTGEVATLLEDHNKVRITLVDDEILNRTGNAVKLRPIKLKNLTWIVDGRKIS